MVLCSGAGAVESCWHWGWPRELWDGDRDTWAVNGIWHLQSLGLVWTNSTVIPTFLLHFLFLTHFRGKHLELLNPLGWQKGNRVQKQLPNLGLVLEFSWFT